MRASFLQQAIALRLSAFTFSQPAMHFIEHPP
jgi:hypothetical protein